MDNFSTYSSFRAKAVRQHTVQTCERVLVKCELNTHKDIYCAVWYKVSWRSVQTHTSHTHTHTHTHTHHTLSLSHTHTHTHTTLTHTHNNHHTHTHTHTHTTHRWRSSWPAGSWRSDAGRRVCPVWRWSRGGRAADRPVGPAQSSDGRGAASTGWTSPSLQLVFCWTQQQHDEAQLNSSLRDRRQPDSQKTQSYIPHNAPWHNQHYINVTACNIIHSNERVHTAQIHITDHNRSKWPVHKTCPKMMIFTTRLFKQINRSPAWAGEGQRWSSSRCTLDTCFHMTLDPRRGHFIWSRLSTSDLWTYSTIKNLISGRLWLCLKSCINISALNIDLISFPIIQFDSCWSLVSHKRLINNQLMINISVLHCYFRLVWLLNKLWLWLSILWSAVI